MVILLCTFEVFIKIGRIHRGNGGEELMVVNCGLNDGVVLVKYGSVLLKGMDGVSTSYIYCNIHFGCCCGFIVFL